MDVKYFDLNSAQVLTEWRIKDALREFISNAFDEHIILNLELNQVSVSWNNGIVTIKDNGRGIENKHFTLAENNEKQDHPGIIGQFGYGLKDAVATLGRLGSNVIIESKYGYYTFEMRAKYGYDTIQTLHMIEYPSKDTNMAGTCISINNVKEDDFIKAKDLFLFFQLDRFPLFTCAYGEVYRSTGRSYIYVNGLKIHENEDYEYVYNITTKDAKLRRCMNRERNGLGVSAYSNRVQSILTSVVGPLLDEMIDLYNNQKNIKLKRDLSYAKVQKYILSKMKVSLVLITPDQIVNHPDMVNEIINAGTQTHIVSTEEYNQLKDITQDNQNNISTFETYAIPQTAYRNPHEKKFIEIGQNFIMKRKKISINYKDPHAKTN